MVNMRGWGEHKVPLKQGETRGYPGEIPSYSVVLGNTGLWETFLLTFKESGSGLSAVVSPSEMEMNISWPMTL